MTYVNEIRLTSSLKDTLSALVELSNDSDSTIKADAIADVLDRNPGTIRNQMQNLKALRLVEGVPGPHGGYAPTDEAYAVLGVERLETIVPVPVLHEGVLLEDVTVEEINLLSVHDPDRCRAAVHVQGSIHDIHEGDRVVIGPTTVTRLVIEGIVDRKDGTRDLLRIRIDTMSAPGPTPQSTTVDT